MEAFCHGGKSNHGRQIPVNPGAAGGRAIFGYVLWRSQEKHRNHFTQNHVRESIKRPTILSLARYVIVPSEMFCGAYDAPQTFCSRLGRGIRPLHSPPIQRLQKHIHTQRKSKIKRQQTNKNQKNEQHNKQNRTVHKLGPIL